MIDELAELLEEQWSFPKWSIGMKPYSTKSDLANGFRPHIAVGISGDTDIADADAGKILAINKDPDVQILKLQISALLAT